MINHHNCYIFTVSNIVLTSIYGGEIMSNKKIIFLAILFVGILAISTASAADNSTNDIIHLSKML